MKFVLCLLAIVAAAYATTDVDILARITKEKVAAFEPDFKQKFEAKECAAELEDDESRKGPASYLLWAQKQKSNPLIQGCTCKETVAITKAVRNTVGSSKNLDLVTDFAHVWRAFCEGKEDPIQDQTKFSALLGQITAHAQEHVLEFVKWGEELVRGYLKSLSLTDKDWNFRYVMDQIESRKEDEQLITAMEFCYVLDIKKEVYEEIAQDTNNNLNEQRFIRHFVDLARENADMVEFLKSNQNHVAAIINNAAALFKVENSDNEETFKIEVDKFVKAFFSPDKTKNGPWKIDMLSGALAKYCKEPYDDNTAIEEFGKETVENVQKFVKENPIVWC